MSLKEYLDAQFNSIQGTIYNFMQPITSQYTKEIVFAFLNIWCNSDDFGKIGMPVNEGCEKIIQLLLSMSIEAHEVIDSVTQYIIEKKFHCTKQKKDTTLDDKAKEGATA